jgi:nicotinamidase-related amidase
MNNRPSLLSSLIDVDDSILIVIDVQERFLTKLPAAQRELLLNRIGWLVSVATRLGVPVVAMGEDVPHMGGVAPAIAERLPPGTHVHNKMVFELAAQPAILAAVTGTGRRTAVLVGIETDVCVAHSALGLLQNGLQVVALADATAAPGTAHDFGLERMRGAGVIISSVKGIFYEWLRTVDRNDEFREQYFGELAPPPGVEL